MDRTDIIRRRIACLRSEKYAYLTEYLDDKNNDLDIDYNTFVAEEWRNLLNYLENKVLPEGLEYNVAEEQSRIDYAKIYTGKSLREYINNIPAPEDGDKAVGELTDYLNCKLKFQYEYDGTPIYDRLCYVHEDYTRLSLPVIAKCIKDQGEEELYRSALIVLDYDRILKTCIEDQNRAEEYRMFRTLMDRLQNLKYCGYDRIYLHNIGSLREMLSGWNLQHSLRIPYLCLGVRVIMSGRFSYFVQSVIQQHDMDEEEQYGNVIVPKQCSKHCKIRQAKNLPQLTPEANKHVEDILLSTAREVFFTDELLTYQSLTAIWWNYISRYNSRLKYNTTRFRTWKFQDWMVQLVEYYILHTLLAICDTQEDRERVEKYKSAAMENLPEQFHDKAFTENPYGDPIFELVQSTGIVSEMRVAETNEYVYYVPIPEVAAYYLQKIQGLDASKA